MRKAKALRAYMMQQSAGGCLPVKIVPKLQKNNDISVIISFYFKFFIQFDSLRALWSGLIPNFLLLTLGVLNHLIIGGDEYLHATVLCTTLGCRIRCDGIIPATAHGL